MLRLAAYRKRRALFARRCGAKIAYISSRCGKTRCKTLALLCAGKAASISANATDCAA